MPTHRKTIVICALAALFAFTPIASAKVYRLYYLGGQSNMDGYGYVKELTTELNKPIENVYIFQSQETPDNEPINGKGLWTQLKPGHGAHFKSDGKTNTYSDRFGIEMSFAARLKELYPNENIALIKYSKGGTSINPEAAGDSGCWEPDFSQGQGINQYDHALAAIHNAMIVPDIDSDGEPDTLIPMGILWMQGESDSWTPKMALEYQARLTKLINLLRAALHTDDLPVAIGRISDSHTNQKNKDGLVWPYGETIRAAQAAFTNDDPYAELVTSTDNYKYSDPWHYDSPGFIDFGIQFANTIANIPDPRQQKENPKEEKEE